MRSVALILLTGAALVGCGSQANRGSSNKAAAQETYQSAEITISKELLTSSFAKQTNSTEQVNDVVNGMRVTGTSENVGETYVEISDNAKRASFSVLYKGTSDADTVGRKNTGMGRHVRVDSTSKTNLHSRKQIFFQETGYTSLPNKTNASTDLTINRVALYNARGQMARIGQQQARSQVMSQRASSEKATAQRVASKANKRVDDETNESLLTPHKDYLKTFYNPIVKPGYLPGAVVTSSNPERMVVVTDQIKDDRTGEVSSKPDLSPTDGIRIVVHQTLLNGIFTKMFGGKQIKISEFKKQLATLTNSDAVVTPDDDKYSIAFPADQNPMEISMDDDQLNIVIRSTGYFVDTNREPAMDVSANYKLQINGDGNLQGVRNGDIVVLPAGYKPGDPLSSRQRDLQSKLKKAYATELKPEIVMDKLPMANGFGDKKLLVKTLLTTKGWIGMILDN